MGDTNLVFAVLLDPEKQDSAAKPRQSFYFCSNTASRRQAGQEKTAFPTSESHASDDSLLVACFVLAKGRKEEGYLLWEQFST